MKIDLAQVIKLDGEQKKKVFRELKATIEGDGTNVDKLAMIQKIIVRVTDEQKRAFKTLSTETKTPLSIIIRKSLNAIVKQQMTVKKMTPVDKRKQLKAFQKRMGLID